MGNSTKELINAFNLNNYACDKISTNFTVEGKKIVGLFASDTNIKVYLQRIGEEIIKRHYGTKGVASKFYNLNCFPFVLGANANKKHLGKGIVVVELADSTDDEVICNLKIHFANELKRVVEAKVDARLQKAGIMEKEAHEWIRGTVGTGAIGKPYLYCIAFSDEYLKREYDLETFEVLKGMYIQEFNSRLRECGLKGSDFYEYKDDMLYIKNIGDEVVKNVAKYVKKEVALDFRTPGKEDSKVENFKDVLSSLMSKWVRKFINTYDYDIFTDEKKIQNGDSFVLIPLIEMDDGQFETLSSRDASKINGVSNTFISDIKGKTANPQYTNCKDSVYAFSNKHIALLLPEIMESPIAYNQINGRFEFVVDLGNFRSQHGSLSPERPKTPPNQRKADTGSGYDSNSPPKPKDSVAPSTSGGPRSLFEQPQAQPRQGSEKSPLYNHINLAGTSKEFPPLPQLNSIAVSYGVSWPSKSGGNLGVAAASGSIPGSSLWSQSEPSSSRGAGKNMLTGSSSWSVPPSTSSLTTRNDSISSNLGIFADPPEDTENICSMKEKQQVTKEEKNLFKELLYVFNLNNYILEYPNTNFIVENGKIASSIHDGVNVEEYLEELKKFMREKYCGTEEEAYDLNEFPFDFLSNCEKNQETTVVANISRGALSNLKKLFIREHEGKVEIGDIDININIVEKAVKSKKDIWVNSQVQELGVRPRKAITTCYPDESKLEYIPIIKGKDKYYLDRTFETWEVGSFVEQWRAKGTSVAGKEKPKDNKDSGYSSGFVTDAENVSSKAEATTSGYESMDCENTRGGSPKRTLELSVENLRISTKLDATKAEQHSPIKKFRSN